MAARRKQPAKPLPKQDAAEYSRGEADRVRAMVTEASWDARDSLHAVAKAYDVIAKLSDPKVTASFFERMAKQARQRVELGERHIRKQRKIFAELIRDGHDAAARAAKQLLDLFEQMQIQHKEHYARLKHGAAEAKRKARG
jgi:hypothetical protein